MGIMEPSEHRDFTRCSEGPSVGESEGMMVRVRVGVKVWVVVNRFGVGIRG